MAVRVRARTVVSASATRRAAPRGEPAEPLRSRCATTTGADAGGGGGGEQRVQPAHPGVAEPGALLGVPVHLDDRVIHVDQHPLARIRRAGSSGARLAQGGQEPGGDGVELADVPEGERPQERAQRRRRVRPLEHPAHPAVAQQGHVVDAVRAGDIPATSETTFSPALAPLSVGTLNRSCANSASPAESARASIGTSPAEATPDSGHRRPPTLPRAV